MKATENMWRTDAGDYVPTGHPDGQALAYAAGDDVPDGTRLRAAPAPKPAAESDADEEAKAAPKPANKQRTPAANK